MNNNKGFGIIQILIAVVILGFVGALAFKNYAGKTTETVETGNKSVQRAKEAEGKIFIASVINAEKTYEAVNGNYIYTDWTSSNKELGVNTAGNRYFKEFSVSSKPGGGYTVSVRGSGELDGVILTSDD